MQTSELVDRINTHLRVLTKEIGARPPGTGENRLATDYLQRVLSDSGLEVVARKFKAKYWIVGPGFLETKEGSFSLDPDPFSTPCEVVGTVARLTSRQQLFNHPGLAGRIVVLDDDLATEKYFPKNFPFIGFPEHQDVISALEKAAPAAVLALSPTEFPIEARFEDGDLTFPTATLPPSAGKRLTEGMSVRLQLAGEVREGDAFNISALNAGEVSRTVVSAHIDTKAGTPGAFDNGGSVATLLAMAEGHMFGSTPVELVFFNGEDHYAAPGEQAWLADTDLATVVHVINLDGAGVVNRRTSIASMAFPAELEARLSMLLLGDSRLVASPPWFESDHAIFAMQGIPSLAITSENVHDLLQTLAHTEDDTIDNVDPLVLSEAAGFVEQWLQILEEERLGAGLALR